MDFQAECLKAHNEYRKKHGVAPLKLDKEICKVAQQWANHLINRGTMVHSNNKEYGENLYSMSSSNHNFTVTGKEAVDAWYEEIHDHTFGVEPSSLASGHFTQVVWKDSTKLGVAFAKSGGKVIVVANYYPPGNYIGNFSANVPPVGGFSGNNNNHEDLVEPVSKLSIAGKMKALLHKDTKNGTEGKFEEDFLNAHNEYRKRHGVPPLKLDKKLCKYSDEWARHLAAKNILEHRPNCNYGENIYCMYSSDPNFTITGHSPVDVWYDEVEHHPFGKEPNNLKSGHFTQVIWKSSELLGVGVAKNSQGSIYVVGNYSPAGNFVGSYVENVPAPLGNKLPQKSEKEVAVSKSKRLEDEFPQFAIDGLKVHNEYRKKHGVPDLKLNKEVFGLIFVIFATVLLFRSFANMRKSGRTLVQKVGVCVIGLTTLMERIFFRCILQTIGGPRQLEMLSKNGTMRLKSTLLVWKALIMVLFISLKSSGRKVLI